MSTRDEIGARLSRIDSMAEELREIAQLLTQMEGDALQVRDLKVEAYKLERLGLKIQIERSRVSALLRRMDEEATT